MVVSANKNVLNLCLQYGCLGCACMILINVGLGLTRYKSDEDCHLCSLAALLDKHETFQSYITALAQNILNKG
jgi:hypothetical protein